MKFSIIIPVKAINDYVHENIEHILQQTYVDWEVFILPNELEPNPWENNPEIRVISSGRVAPGRKRDLGASHANGDVLVFLDDDSYPARDYLEIAYVSFSDPNVKAIGGPGITPPDNNFLQKLSGAILSSRFSGGFPERYVSIEYIKKNFSDWPSVNLLVRKSVFESVGGFDNDYWPGEDTLFCSKLHDTGFNIIYNPRLIVYHHRRENISKHFSQIFKYGLFRGFLFRKGKSNSRKLVFIIPSTFVFFVVTTIIAPLLPESVNNVFILLWLFYLGAMTYALYEISRYNKIYVSFLAVILVPFTHLSYGVGFLIGLLSSNIQAKLR